VAGADFRSPAREAMMRPQLESPAQSILVVDDDPAMCQMLEEVLTQEGYRPITCLRPEDALAVSRQDSFQLAFVDIQMPGMSGLELAAKLKEAHADREVVFITGSTVIDHAVQAIKLGAYDYLRKPFTITEFKLCLARFQERVRLKECILRAEQRYFQLVQTLPLLIYVLRRDLQLDFINRACIQILGYTPEEALETPQWLLARVHPEDRDRIEKTIHAIFAAGEPPATVECRLVHKKGHTIHAMAKFIPSWESNGGRGAEYLEGIMVDISDHVFLERTLVQKEKLNTLGAISAEVAHEIRNPLVSIGGFARRLQVKYPELSEVDIILRESQRLERILDRIRNYLKPVEIRSQDCAVNDLLNDCVYLLAPEIERYSIHYRMDLDPEDPLVCADLDVLSQVFINLIRNAIVAMKKGEAFTILTYRDVRGVHIEFRNQTNKPKIKNPELLFLPFDEGGQSIGLPLCYRLVKSMGGLLSFAQEQNHVVFTVSLPEAGRSETCVDSIEELKV
jgi:two-component system sensor histidine kinase HydH